MQTVSHSNGTCNPQVTTPFPEAPCSLNCYVDIPGLDRVQVTGRGMTPHEAVANLQGTVHELQARTLPQTREDRLAAMLAKGLSKAAQQQDQGLAERLMKAALLVLTGAVEPGNRPGLRTVRSQENPDLWYDIEDQMCTCPDWTKQARAGQARPCKHLLAVAMWTRLED